VIHWPSYNQSLVRRGEILFSYDFLDSWDSELERMNKNKEGKPYLYPDSFILAIGCIRYYYFHLPYRQTEGIIKVAGGRIPNHPCYEQICKRINKLNINDGNSEIDESEDVTIAIDSTGIKVTNRGQWLRDKWFVKKKGYLKIHVAVNVRTKEILALEVTDEKVHDGKMMCRLVDRMLKQNNAVNIKTVLEDGAYDSNESFKYLQEKKIQPGIKVRENSIISSKNNKVRNREVKLQTDDLLKWKKKREYGKRWIAETAFSSIKRTYGEYVCATKFQNMVKEMIMKVYLYNLFRRMA
jgi:hypothetical protein